MSANEIQNKARELKELKVMKDELEAEITAIEDALKAAMGEQEGFCQGITPPSISSIMRLVISL